MNAIDVFQNGGLSRIRVHTFGKAIKMNETTIATPTHLHWADHEPAPPAVHFAVGVFITVIGAVATFANILVVWICSRYKDLRTRSNILIINLAVGDLLMCVIDFPLLAVASFFNVWPYGWMLCQAYAFLTAVAGMVTINTLAVIAADRYWAVVRRPNPGQQVPKCVTTMAVIFVWGYSIAWAVCPILGWGAYILDGIGTTCTFDYLTRSWKNRSFVMSMVAGNFALPFSLMIFSYTRIWMAIREIKSGLEKESSHVSLGKRAFSFESLSSGYSVKRRSSSFKHCYIGGEYYQTDAFLKTSFDHVQRDENSNEDKEGQEVIQIHRNKDIGQLNRFHRGPLYFNRKRILVRGKTINFENIPNQDDIASTKNEAQNNTDLECIMKRKFSSKGDMCKTSYRGFESGTNKYVNTNQNSFVAFSTNHLAKTNETEFVNGEDSLIPDDVFVSDDNAHNRKRLSNGKLQRSVLNKIKFKCNSTLGSKLFLKQRRYRLHCEHKTMKIIMFLLMAFTLSWCPYMVISIIGLFGDPSQISYLSSVIPSLIAKTSIVFNPLLYSISHPKVRKRILNTLCTLNRSQRPKLRTRANGFSSSMSNT